MEKKFKLTSESKEIDGVTVYRIEALKSFGSVKKGDKGGWLQREANLSHYDECWVFNNAVVRDYAWIRDYAEVRDNAVVRDYSMVRHYAEIRDEAEVRDSAMVRDYVNVSGNVLIRWGAVVRGDSFFSGNIELSDYAWAPDNLLIRDKGCISGNKE